MYFISITLLLEWKAGRFMSNEFLVNLSDIFKRISPDTYFNLFLNIIIIVGTFITAIGSARYTIKKEVAIQKNIKQVEYANRLYEQLAEINSINAPHFSQLQRIIDLTTQGKNHNIDHLNEIGDKLIRLQENIDIIIYYFRFIQKESIRMDGERIKIQLNAIINSFKALLHSRQATENYLESSEYFKFEKDLDSLNKLLSGSYCSVDQLLSELIDEVYL